MKVIKPSIQEALQIPGRVTTKPTPRSVIVKLLKTKDKTVKATRGEKICHYFKRRNCLSGSWHCHKNDGSQRLMEDTFKGLKVKIWQPGDFYLMK